MSREQAVHLINPAAWIRGDDPRVRLTDLFV
jgi:hypothetical protein